MRAHRYASNGGYGARPLLWRAMAIAFLVVLASAAGAQAVLWERVAGRGEGLGLAYAAPGVVIAAGNTSMSRWTSAYTVSGERLDGGASTAPSAYEGGPIIYFVDSAFSIAPAPGGAVLVGGSQTCIISVPFGGTDCSPMSLWIERYVASAVPQWHKPADGGVVAADDTGAYVAGGSEARMQKFGTTGTLVWDRTFLPSGAVGGFWDVAAFPGGGAVAAGSSEAGPLLQRVDAAGTARWASPVVPALGASTILQRVAVDAAGNVYAAGRRAGTTPGVDDIVLARFDAGGGLAWMRTRPGVAPGRGTATHDTVTALAVDAGGNALVAGMASTAVDYVAWTAKVDPAGSVLWTDEFTTSDDARTEARALGLDALGHAYVGGTGVGASGAEGFVRKLGPGGTAMWTLRWPGTLSDVIVGGSGEVLVLENLAYSFAGTLMRLDPGAGEGAAPPTLLLALPPEPIAPGLPLTLAATIRGATTRAPTGVATFRVDGVDACTAVVLQPVTATTSKAQCVLQQGLPVGTVRIEVAYGGDANNAAAVASTNVSVGAVAVTEVPTLAPGALAALVGLLALVGMRAAQRPE